MESIKNFSNRLWEETKFWGEVLVEVLGLDRNQYTDMIEAHKRDLEEQQRQRDIEIRRGIYHGKSS